MITIHVTRLPILGYECRAECLCGMRRTRQNAQNRLSLKFQNDSQVLLSVNLYSVLQPSDKSSAILDIGFDGGYFLAVCLKLGYTSLSGAEFRIEHQAHVADW
jgi:hypothetical protein